MIFNREAASKQDVACTVRRLATIGLALFLLPIALMGMVQKSFAQPRDSHKELTTLLADNFSQDSLLNPALWTSDSQFLLNLASASSSPAGVFVTPAMLFTQTGVLMTGPLVDYQTTGFQSVAAFTGPFTVTASVEARKGSANPFEIFLASADLSQFVTVSCNVSSAYDGMWADAPNIGQMWQLGEQFEPSITPVLKTVYSIQVSMDAEGNTTASISSNGQQLGMLSNLQAGGSGPYYLVLGQRIGNAPQTGQFAEWQSVQVTTP